MKKQEIQAKTGFRLFVKCFAIVAMALMTLSCEKDNEEEPSLLDKFSNMSEEEKAYAREHWLVAPEQYENDHNHPTSYIIQQAVAPDTQTGVECSGCASAYLLRFFGEDVNGVDLYHQSTFPCKHEQGAYPKCFKILFEEQYNYITKYYTGTTDDLKNAVSKGTPVIVLLLYEGKITHYVPVVGYDEDNFYIQDSVDKYRNVSNNNTYNESVSIATFDSMWNIPLESCQRLFVMVEPAVK